MKKYSAKTITGKGRGKKIGFPTINLKLEKELKITGVFKGALEISNKTHQGVVFVGTSKTFGNKKKTYEIHLFDFNQEINKNTVVNLLVGTKIREIQKFKSIKDLIKAIEKDCEQAKNMKE